MTVSMAKKLETSWKRKALHLSADAIESRATLVPDGPVKEQMLGVAKVLRDEAEA